MSTPPKGGFGFRRSAIRSGARMRYSDYPDMRDWVVDFASHPTTEEMLVALETTPASYDTPGATRESVLADHGADRR